MSFKNESTRCKGTTKRGEPCRAAATAGGLCFFHANPNRASQLGRIGGRSKRNAAAETADPLPLSNSNTGRGGTRKIIGFPPFEATPLPLLDDAIAVRDTVTRLIADVHEGKVQPKVAAELAALLSLRLRALDAVREFERLERCHIHATWWQARRIAERSVLDDDESN
jgi:hypothetical protein